MVFLKGIFLCTLDNDNGYGNAGGARPDWGRNLRGASSLDFSQEFRKIQAGGSPKAKEAILLERNSNVCWNPPEIYILLNFLQQHSQQKTAHCRSPCENEMVFFKVL